MVSDVPNEHVGFILRDPADKSVKSGYIGTVTHNIFFFFGIDVRFGCCMPPFTYEGWNFNSGTYLSTTDTK